MSRASHSQTIASNSESVRLHPPTYDVYGATLFIGPLFIERDLDM